MEKILKTKTLKEIIDQILLCLISIQLLYVVVVNFLFNSSDTISISIPFYSPIGLIISYGLICLAAYALSYTYEILKGLLTAYIFILGLRLVVFYTLGEHYESRGSSITVGPWTLTDSFSLVLALASRIVLPKINLRYNLSYRGKLYFRFLKFKQYQIANRPILK